jgi:hypothetical protein
MDESISIEKTWITQVRERERRLVSIDAFTLQAYS